MPEYMTENLETKYLGDEIHPGETVEEKISLSERFGLWVTFYPFDQDEYLDIVEQWLKSFGASSGEKPGRAPQWALQRGSRSGRVAYQFARDWAGRNAKEVIEVAAAVIQRRDGAFLLAQPPAGKVYAGYWGFPGGKIEPGEAAPAALARELREGLGIEIGPAYPWIRVFTPLPHGTVRLRSFAP